MKKLIIFGDENRPHVAEAVADFLKFCRGRAEVLANCLDGACDPEVIQQGDYAVVFGGDGTILSTVRYLRGSGIPVIGVNLGKLGFLAEFGYQELKESFEQICSDEMVVEKRMMLTCCIWCDSQEKFRATAINDVVISAGEPFNMLELDMSVSGQHLAEVVSDGMIFCTPTGSTAYNLSAGGPILAANLAAIVITPICPHSFSFRPVVIGSECEIRVTAKSVNPGTTLMLDGRAFCKLSRGDVVEIKRDGNVFLIVNNPRRTKWDTLAGKLRWGEKPRYNTERG